MLTLRSKASNPELPELNELLHIYIFELMSHAICRILQELDLNFSGSNHNALNLNLQR